MKLTLKARPPFSLNAVARSHGWVSLAPFNLDEELGVLSYLYRLSSGKVLELAVRESNGGVICELDRDITKEEGAEISSKLAWMLGLEKDFSQFYALAKQEPKLAHVVKNAQGRVLRSPTLYEDVVKTILTTNTAWSGTKRMNLRLVENYGSPLESDTSRHAFPTPEQIASLDEARLRGEAGLGYRAPYVLELSRSVATGDIDLESLKESNLPTPQLRKRLLALKGVGGYAAANLLMILGRYDFLPIDSWATKVVSHEWYDGKPVGAAEVESAFERWGEWKGLAYWFWDWSLLAEG